MNRKRRALVLCDESARHPFRQSLPPHVRSAKATTMPDPSWLQVAVGDWRNLVAAYCTTLIVALVFIS